MAADSGAHIDSPDHVAANRYCMWALWAQLRGALLLLHGYPAGKNHTGRSSSFSIAGLASFKLLPELLSAAKTGQSSLPPLTYSTTSLPAVDVLQQFAQVRVDLCGVLDGLRSFALAAF